MLLMEDSSYVWFCFSYLRLTLSSADGKQLTFIILATILSITTPAGSISPGRSLVYLAIFRILRGIGVGGDHPMSVTYWGDDVTIYQLVITTSFHFSLLSLIARHITIVTPESTIQSYQYITTVTLFTRTQSSTLGPRWLEYNNIFFIPTFTVALLLSLSALTRQTSASVAPWQPISLQIVAGVLLSVPRWRSLYWLKSSNHAAQ